MITAIVSQTKARAQQLAADLGIETKFVFGAAAALSFEGLSASLVIIDSSATISPRFMQTIRCTVLKTPGGRIRFVTVTDDSDH